MKRGKLKIIRRIRRQKRVRAKIFSTKARPRLSIFRSNQHIYVQLINDQEGKTLVSASDQELKLSKKLNKMEKAEKIGELIAKKALEKKIKKVFFDSSGYKYHGKIKALAEGARKGGLKFG